MRNVVSLDISAMRSLSALYEKYEKAQVRVLFSHVNPQPMSVMKKAGFYDMVGEENFLNNIDEALEYAKQGSVTK